MNSWKTILQRKPAVEATLQLSNHYVFPYNISQDPSKIPVLQKLMLFQPHPLMYTFQFACIEYALFCPVCEMILCLYSIILQSPLYHS